METKGTGLYVHIPFCVRKCNYCDFTSFSSVTDKRREAYINKLLSEIGEYKREPGILLDTVYFGGGTPSLLTVDELAIIIEKIKEVFSLTEDAEITLEVNPGTLTSDKIEGFAKLGINRVSIGMQTIHDNEYKILGRIHNLDDFEKCYRLVLDSGISNINVDLMYAIPEQTLDSFSETLDYIIALSPSHISAYSLIIEEGTPFFSVRDSLRLPTEDEEIAMYGLLCGRLSEAGYSHYEVSNYARAGFESRHNLRYWKCMEYIGVGLSAYSYFDGVRYGNTASLDAYLSDDYKEYRDVDTQGDSRQFEYAMLHLRLKGGFSLSEYRSLFGEDFLSVRKEKIKKYEALGYLCVSGDRIFLTEEGFYLSNTVLSDLL